MWQCQNTCRGTTNSVGWFLIALLNDCDWTFLNKFHFNSSVCTFNVRWHVYYLLIVFVIILNWEKNSQFAIIRILQLKSILWYSEFIAYFTRSIRLSIVCSFLSLKHRVTIRWPNTMPRNATFTWWVNVCSQNGHIFVNLSEYYSTL